MLNIHIDQIVFLIFLFFVVLGICLAVMEHNRKGKAPIKDRDFITDYTDGVRNRLAASGGMDANVYIAIQVAAPILLSSIGFFATRNVFVTVILCMLGIRMPNIILGYINFRSEKKFEERYANSLEQLGASLRAGKSIMQAVNDVAKAPLLHPSIKRRYAQLSADMQMGMPVKDAFYRFAKETHSRDAMDVALAIDVQNTVGGREAEVVLGIANSINQRLMLRNEISSIFSSTSSMVWMMDFIPILVIVGFCVVNKSYTEVYFSSIPNMLVLTACIMFPLIGSVISHRTLNQIKRRA